jgi:hypothetical protein
MKHFTKYLFLAILAVVLMSSTAIVFAAQNGPAGRGAGGEVTAIEGTTIKVSNPRDEEVSIITNGDTQFTVNGEDGDLSQVQVGMFVFARGERSEEGTVTATHVFATNEVPQRPDKGQSE